MDKQEYIEKMAGNIKEALGCGCRMISNSSCNDCEFLKYRKPETDCQSMCIAEALYNEYYRKVPDGAVVLTKEEYERLKSDRKMRVVTKYEEDDYEICIPASDYDEMLKQERKETAKEILQILNTINNGAIKLIVKELAARFDVEVEE